MSQRQFLNAHLALTAMAAQPAYFRSPAQPRRKRQDGDALVTVAAQKSLLGCLCLFADAKGEHSCPSTATIMQITGLQHAAIERAKAELEDQKWIKSTGYRQGGGREANEWSVNLARLKEAWGLNYPCPFRECQQPGTPPGTGATVVPDVVPDVAQVHRPAVNGGPEFQTGTKTGTVVFAVPVNYAQKSPRPAVNGGPESPRPADIGGRIKELNRSTPSPVKQPGSSTRVDVRARAREGDDEVFSFEEGSELRSVSAVEHCGAPAADEKKEEGLSPALLGVSGSIGKKLKGDPPVSNSRLSAISQQAEDDPWGEPETPSDGKRVDPDVRQPASSERPPSELPVWRPRRRLCFACFGPADAEHGEIENDDGLHAACREPENAEAMAEAVF